MNRTNPVLPRPAQRGRRGDAMYTACDAISSPYVN
jgi:hypothetical protein